MLVDTASQYGVGSIYLLAGWFQLAPIGYGTFGFLDGILTALLYVAGYCLLRVAGASRLLAAAALALAVVVLAFNLVYPVGALPQQGPLRFGLPLALVLATTAGARWPRRAAAARAAALLVLALASIWALEALAFTAVTFAAMAVVQARLLPAGSRVRWLRPRGALRPRRLPGGAPAVRRHDPDRQPGSCPNGASTSPTSTPSCSDSSATSPTTSQPGLRGSPSAPATSPRRSRWSCSYAASRPSSTASGPRCSPSPASPPTASPCSATSSTAPRTTSSPTSACRRCSAAALWLSLLLRTREGVPAATRAGGTAFALAVAVLALVGRLASGSERASPTPRSATPSPAATRCAMRSSGSGTRRRSTPGRSGRRGAGRALPAGRRRHGLVLTSPDLGIEILLRSERANRAAVRRSRGRTASSPKSACRTSAMRSPACAGGSAADRRRRARPPADAADDRAPRGSSRRPAPPARSPCCRSPFCAG